MSRTFRVISGSGSDSAADREKGERGGNGTGNGGPTFVDPFYGETIPYVEIGGPEGTVSSANKPMMAAPRVETAPFPRPEVFNAPRLAQPPEPIHQDESDSKYLSVTFHRIPKVGLRLMQTGVAPEVVAYHFPDHAVSAEYRVVRDEIVRQFEEPGPRTMFFTSSNSNAGTTTVLINFAVSLVQEFGSRALLVDANFARPGIARRLGCAEAPGLAEVMGQSIPLAWALQPTPLQNIHVLATGTPVDSTEEATARDFAKLLQQLKQWFDWVIVDAGVWGDLPGADAACENADAVYLVTRSGDIELPGFGGLRGEVAANGGHVRGYISTRQ